MSARKAAKRIPRYKRWMESARRWGQSFVTDVRETVERKVEGAGSGRSKAKPKRPPRGSTWPMCAQCFHRVPEVCPTCEKSWAGITRNHTSACCKCQNAPARNEGSRPPDGPEELIDDEVVTEGTPTEGAESVGGEVGPNIEGPSAPPEAPSAPAPAAPTPAPAMPAPPIAAG